MKSEIFSITKGADDVTLGLTVAAGMLARNSCADINSKGYTFYFPRGYACTFKRKSPAFMNACLDFVQYAKREDSNIEIFMNVNNEISLRLA